ncbi:MAG: hypothetical protein P1V19_25885 [Gimesia sp.]|nr:hypothetical protein [Gimesia sp.]
MTDVNSPNVSDGNKDKHESDEKVNPQEQNVIAEMKNTSRYLTDLCRYIAFGLLAVSFSVFTSESRFTNMYLIYYEYHLVSVCIFSSIGLIFDYFQFLAGYFAANAAFKNKENNFEYDDVWFSWNLRRLMFWMKQFFILCGACLFAFSLFDFLKQNF